MIVAKLERQQVLGALKATGSRDPDILFATKEGLLADTRKHKLLGIVPLIIGTIMTITIIGAIVGIPMLIFGFVVRSSLKRNIEVADSALAEFMANQTAAATA